MGFKPLSEASLRSLSLRVCFQVVLAEDVSFGCPSLSQVFFHVPCYDSMSASMTLEPVYGCPWCLTLVPSGWGWSLCRWLLLAPCSHRRLLSWWSSLWLRVFGCSWFSPWFFNNRRYDSRATCSAHPPVSRLSFVLGEFSFGLGFGLCLTIL